MEMRCLYLWDDKQKTMDWTVDTPKTIDWTVDTPNGYTNSGYTKWIHQQWIHQQWIHQMDTLTVDTPTVDIPNGYTKCLTYKQYDKQSPIWQLQDSSSNMKT